MISADNIEFPNNVITLLTTRAPGYVDPTGVPGVSQIAVFKRPLRPSDGTQCIGFFPAQKRPDDTSFEMRSKEPTLKRYSIIMQTLVTSADEEECIAIHSVLSNRLYRLWYRDSPLDAGLTALAVEADNSRERLQRRGIELQRYLSNEIDGSFIQTSWIECWIETETVETT
jgi:hypothetical protein